jgi:hypothetical protein
VSTLSDSFLSKYAEFEQEDRGHGANLRIKCGKDTSSVDETLLHTLGANVSVRLDDRRSCLRFSLVFTRGLVWCLREVEVGDYEKFRSNSVYPLTKLN